MSALRVMVVDGDRATRELLRASLARAGYAARTLAEAGEAIESFRRERPDVVLLDANMPGTGASTLVQELRAVAGEPWLPIIHLTMATDDDARDRAPRARADWTMVKPCSFAVLEARLDGIGNILHLRRELEQKNRTLAAIEERTRQELALARQALRAFNRIEPECLRFLQFWIVPAAGLAGDTISAVRAPDGAAWVMLADNTGHGLAAALNAIPVTRAFQAMAAKGLKLAAVIGELNRIVRGHLERENPVAATIVRISRNDNLMEVWNGGNPGAFLLDAHGAIVKAFRSRHPPLGELASADLDVRMETAVLSSHLQLAIVSDGLLQIGADRPFGEPGLFSAFAAAPATKRFGSIVSRLQEIMSGQANRDDASLALVDCDAILDRGPRSTLRAPEEYAECPGGLQ